MFKRLCCLAGLTLCFVLGVTSFAAAGKVPEIRVLLKSNTNLAVITVAQGKYDVVNSETGMRLGKLREGDVCVFTKEGPNVRLTGFECRDDNAQKGTIWIEPSDKDDECLVSFNNVQYRGSIAVHNTEKGLIVVNSLPIEEYLYGVVGQEMGYGAPFEALKSQAVVSRTYAMKKLGSGLYYDLTNTSQAYKGYNAELVSGFEKVKEAVDDTEGEVVCYGDELIEAVFHSNSGGYTESSENIWQAAVPYLRAVASPQDVYALTYSYQDASGWPGNSYQWSVTVSREQLKQCIASWNASHPNDVISIGELMDIKVSRVDNTTGGETESRRVTAITLVGSLGEKVITKDNIRSFFKVDGKILKSTLFDISFDYGNAGSTSNLVASASGNNSRYIPPFSGITINGRGNGHGLGLSQWGARGMAAQENMDYEEIIKHYYTGVELEEIY